jgi:hypothetical protein
VWNEVDRETELGRQRTGREGGREEVVVFVCECRIISVAPTCVRVFSSRKVPWRAAVESDIPLGPLIGVTGGGYREVLDWHLIFERELCGGCGEALGGGEIRDEEERTLEIIVKILCIFSSGCDTQIDLLRASRGEGERETEEEREGDRVKKQTKAAQSHHTPVISSRRWLDA